MAKLTVQPLYLFGRDGSSDNFAKFGSRAAGAASTTKDIATIQSLDQFLAGLQASLLAGSKAPFLEDVNSLFYVLYYQMRYAKEQGIMEWDATIEYNKGAVVKKAGTTELYGSQLDGNVNQALGNKVNTSSWVFLTDWSSSQQTLPPGTIVDYAAATPPLGFLECDGTNVSRVTYANLFAAIGIGWGAGDSFTTFQLPDLRGKFRRGWDHGRGVDPGRGFSTDQTDQFQGHWHQAVQMVGGGQPTLYVLNDGTNNAAQILPNFSVRNPVSDGSNGTPRTGAETRPTNMAVLTCIKY